MESRTIVVGDIHGCYDELMDLLAQLDFGPGDRLVSVGDLITKGPKDREVLELFITDSRFTAVIGNHDLALRRVWNGENLDLKAAQKETHRELGPDKDSFLPYLNSLPFMIDLGSHLVVHAGVRPNVELHSQTTEDLTQIRTLGEDRESKDGKPWYEAYHGEKFVLFGHWPASEPRRGQMALGLDTGCVYGHQLTAYTVETAALTYVNARLAYAS
ncbi:MAG: metallophosphoesterase [Pyrinomonadaceae bacterium]|nr:metallophosphoesterase [Pyrinomonadaceae bacterium]